MKHQDSTLNHPPYNFTFATSAAREAGTGYTIVAADVGKLARQTDDDSLWMLTAATPTWTQVGGGSLPSISSKIYLSENFT